MGLFSAPSPPTPPPPPPPLTAANPPVPANATMMGALARPMQKPWGGTILGAPMTTTAANNVVGARVGLTGTSAPGGSAIASPGVAGAPAVAAP
jgi:hypothetical protein